MKWLSRSRARVRGFMRLSWAERRAFIWSLLVFPVAKLGLRFSNLKRVQQWLAPKHPPQRAADPEEALARAKRLALVVDLAARHGVGNHNCLPRSVVLWVLLRRHGLDSQLRIGVQPNGADGRSFHAWVEYAGRPLNDTPDVAERYLPFGSALPPAPL